MDMKETGRFLAELRREQNLTQEQLGAELGVSNKTVSRWETGTYLPPAEMLLALSKKYGLSVNELLSARRLPEREYRREAESNLAAALEQSAFTWRERADFFKRKWRREHIASGVLTWLAVLAVWLWSLWSGRIGWMLLAQAAALTLYCVRRNRMMIYVEARAFDGTGDGKWDDDKK